MALACGDDHDPGAHPEPAASGPRIVLIGDSWLDQGKVGIWHSLQRAGGQRLPCYAVPGAPLLDFGALKIPDMYTRARRELGTIDGVVMNGGVNDIGLSPGMLADCRAHKPRCHALYKRLLDRLSALWAQMAKDGVGHVLYVAYSDKDRAHIDFALPNGDNVDQRCARAPAPLQCDVLKTNDIVRGELPDALHPSPAAYERLGQAVHRRMQARGMLSPARSR